MPSDTHTQEHHAPATIETPETDPVPIESKESASNKTVTKFHFPEKLHKARNLIGGISLLAGLVALGLLWPTWLLVIGALLLMVTFHELGHFLTAKKFGMEATQFFIGIGPRIWSCKRGETEYGIRLIPVAAYVKITGMTISEDTKGLPEERTFRSKPYWQKFIVLVAGSATHFVLAFGMLALLYSSFGFFSLDPNKAGESWEVSTVTPGSAAEEAGLLPGDKIHAAYLPEADAVYVLPTKTATEEFIRARPGEEVRFSVYRYQGSEKFARHLTPVVISPREGNPNQGIFGYTSDLVTPGPVGPINGIRESAEQFGEGTKLVVVGLAEIFSPAGLYELGERVVAPENVEDDNRPVSIIGISAAANRVASTQNWATLIYLYAVVNLFIGIFNLAPLPPLDGGHIAVFGYERLRSRKGKPYYANPARVLAVQAVVLVVLMLVGFAAIYLDIVDPVI